jgi:predicted neuraminidase
LQPVVLVRNAHEARVLMRHAGPPPHRAVSITTQDAGQHWTFPAWSELRNPDSAISAVVLPDGRMLAALNDIEYGRDALSLMISADGGVTWKTVYQLEDQRGQKPDEAHFRESVDGLLRKSDDAVAAAPAAELDEYLASVLQQACSPSGCHYEFSYPFLLQTHQGEFHLAYTWNRSFIKHVQFNQAWLDRQLERAR